MAIEERLYRAVDDTLRARTIERDALQGKLINLKAIFEGFAENPRGGKMAAIAYKHCARIVEDRINRPMRPSGPPKRAAPASRTVPKPTRPRSRGSRSSIPSRASRCRAGLGIDGVKDLMLVSGWLTLPVISAQTGYPEASISARLRDLRKTKFGAYNVERRYVVNGLWEYRVR